MEARFERIENGLAALVQAPLGIVEGQRVHNETLSQVMQTVSRYIDSSDARLKRTEQIWMR